MKQYPSPFFGTRARAHAAALGIDTLILAGCSTSGCVRAGALDGVQHGYRVILPRECVGDRHDGPHDANLFDINAKYGDVVARTRRSPTFPASRHAPRKGRERDADRHGRRRDRVYWMTGCSSCLRTKEFLTRHGVPFLSRNVLEDEAAYEELARFGLKQVPIVTRGDAWANGQVLRDVARLCGIAYGEQRMLPVDEMRRRLDAVLAVPRATSRRCRTRRWRASCRTARAPSRSSAGTSPTSPMPSSSTRTAFR